MKTPLSVILLILLLAQPMCGDEPGEQFLQALRDQGYHDVALEYLEEMESSPLASASFKASIEFEKAQTLISSTERIRDFKLMEKRLVEAEQLLAKSESKANSPELAAKSQQYRGDLALRRATGYLNLADNERLTATERSKHLATARTHLRESLEAFGQAKNSYREILDGFQLDLRDPESTAKRKLLRATYVFVSARLPLILERSARHAG